MWRQKVWQYNKTIFQLKDIIGEVFTYFLSLVGALDSDEWIPYHRYWDFGGCKYWCMWRPPGSLDFEGYSSLNSKVSYRASLLAHEALKLYPLAKICVLSMGYQL